ncbi:TonB-dependent receptor [uncultured Flavobacterium sp.]|uniref:TonB-dependent receptor plug domain-containing protein n=1 Tax=uncultured Flavobacterium sp. TaxID=165435 RepID=UPI0030ED2362|tara:strand:+ start:52313 stop:54511 length:2199 start_codon:yes stop_codon:yes gene_type:complete
MRKAFLLCTLLIGTYSFSQNTKDTIIVNQLEEVVLSTVRLPNKKETLPIQVETINLKQIEFQNFQNTADLLSNSGTLVVQKSQQGGGSPTIRGFEASRVLLLVDGVRMNNLIYRSGHLQNVISVDENLLESVTIFYGPTSTLFGSDALGGTVNMTTKKAKFSSNQIEKISGNFSTRYSSVNEEKSGHFYFNYAKENWASLTSFSYNDFGDLKMGKRKNHNGNFFGERPFYVETNNGVDILVKNSNPYLQKQSSFKQYNFMQKVAYKTSQGIEHGLNFQFSNSTDIPRYDRLTDASSTGLKNAEWYYGPQKRLLAVYSLSKEKAILNSDLKVDLAYQNVEESRHNRRFGNYNLQNRTENVNMYSISIDLHKEFSKSDLFYGVESYLEDLNSSAFSNNINTGEIKLIDTRYPNGKNNMLRNDLYVSYNTVFSKKTNFNIGARAGYTILNSTISDDTFFSLPFNDINQKNFTYSGTAGLVHKPSKNIDLKTNVSTGFRVPNIDDLAKIFESGGGFVIVPNADLKPEKTITTDLGFVVKTNNKHFQIENTYYFTRFIDAIITDNYLYNGQSTITYNGSQSQVLANQNKGRAFVTGFSTNIKGYIVSSLQYVANFNYTLGRITSEEENTPLDHIPPYYGKVGLNYSKNWGTIEAYILYNGKKPISDYLLNGEDNEQYAPNGGMPAWETYNLKTAFNVLPKATLFVGIENILDTQYRVFASGINAPGRNIYGGLKYEF